MPGYSFNCSCSGLDKVVFSGAVGYKCKKREKKKKSVLKHLTCLLLMSQLLRSFKVYIRIVTSKSSSISYKIKKYKNREREKHNKFTFTFSAHYALLEYIVNST